MRISDPVIGIDVSQYQSTISWDAIKAAGLRFAWIKTSEGVGFTDPAWQRHVSGAQRVGVPWGGYHFARANGPDWYADARSEAEYFCSRGGMSGPLPGLLDMESTSLTRDQTIEWARAFCVRCRELSGRMPVLYWGGYFAGSPAAPNDQRLADCQWLLPSYKGGDPINPTPSLEWVSTNGQRTPDGVQYTSRGRISGYSGDVDLNVYSAASLARLLGPAPSQEDDDMAPPVIIKNRADSTWATTVAGVPAGHQASFLAYKDSGILVWIPSVEALTLWKNLRVVDQGEAPDEIFYGFTLQAFDGRPKQVDVSTIVAAIKAEGVALEIEPAAVDQLVQRVTAAVGDATANEIAERLRG